MVKKIDTQVNPLALAAYEEYAGLTSTPVTDLVIRLHQKPIVSTTRYTHDGEQFLVNGTVTDITPKFENNI